MSALPLLVENDDLQPPLEHMGAWRSDPTRSCRGVDPEVFFPVREKDVGPAKAICAACPVQGPCRQWGIDYEMHGVWGGLSERQRRKARRQGKRSSVPEDRRAATLRRRLAQGYSAEELAAEFGLPSAEHVERLAETGGGDRRGAA